MSEKGGPRRRALLLRVVLRLLPPEDRAGFRDDLAEEHESKRIREDSVSADRWLRRQLLASLRPAVHERVRSAFRPRRDGRGAKGKRAAVAIRDDLRHAWRGVLAGRGHNTLVVIVLGLGIGAATGMFGLLRAVLLTPLPYDDAHRLYAVRTTDPRSVGGLRDVAGPDLYDYLDQARSFQRIAAFERRTVSYEPGRGVASKLDAATMNRGALRILGLAPTLGRGFSAQEDGPEPGSVALISERLWESAFARDPGVVGRTVMLDGRSHEVLGVAPRSFGLPDDRVDVWTPMGRVPATYHRRAPIVEVVVRLPDGVGREAVEAELRAVATRLARQHPDTNDGRVPALEPLRARLAGEDGRTVPLLLAAALGLLFVACLDVSGLLVARGLARGPELRVRLAVGASVGRLTGQLALECALMAAAAAGLGIAVAHAGLTVGRRWLPADLFGGEAVSMNPWVLLFSVGCAALTAVMFGTFPGLASSRAAAGGLVPGRSDAGKRGRLRAGLMAGQVSLSVLLVGSGLLVVDGLLSMVAADRGVDVDRLATATVDLPAQDYPTGMDRYPDWPEIHAFYDAVLAELASLPGAEAVALAGTQPLRGGVFRTDVTVRGPASIVTATVWLQNVSPGWGRAVGVPLLDGRELTPSDRLDSERVVVVNRSFVARYFPGESVLGRLVGFLGAERRIVGVVDDVIPLPSLTAEPAVLAPLAQDPSERVSIVIRGRGDPADVITGMRTAVARVDPGLALYDARPLASQLDLTLARPRFNVVLLAGFAVLALLVTAVGLYGVLAQSMEAQRRGIGIRMAVGARAPQVAWRVVRVALTVVGLGVLPGLVALWWLSGTVGRLVPEAPGLDHRFVTATVLVLLVTGLVASSIPAWRATRVDPRSSLTPES